MPKKGTYMLNKISDNIWTIDDVIPFFGMPYTTRMTLVKLQNGMLWVHSLLKISDKLLVEVSALGEVKNNKGSANLISKSSWLSP